MSPRRKNRIAGQFSARTIEMMESPAYIALGGSARKILDRLEIEHAHHGGNDNGKLPCTYEHFFEYGVHRHSIAPALRELEALGFIEITERGRAGNAEWRRPNLFRLTYRPLGNAKPTDEWRRVRTEADADLIVRNARVTTPRKPAQKNRTPVSVGDNSQCAFRHRKSEFHSTESDTTSHSTESDTTSIFLGRTAPAGRSPLSAPPTSIAALSEAKNSGRPFCDAEVDPWRGVQFPSREEQEQLQTYVLNVVNEQLHDLDLVRVRARKRLQAQLELSA
jgi:hypothetical protein